MKTRTKTENKTATGRFVGALERFAALPAADQETLLRDVLAGRGSRDKLQHIRDILAEAIDESDDEESGGIKYVLWG